MDWATAKDKVVSVSAVDTLNHAFQLMFTQVRAAPPRSSAGASLRGLTEHRRAAVLLAALLHRM